MKHELDVATGDLAALEVLEAAGLVSSRREGRYKFHFFDAAPLKRISQRWPIEDDEEAKR